MASLSLDGDYDFVEPKPLEFDDYLCPVSYELLTDPRQANECCGKHLSREVAERLERDGKPCPLCTTAPLRTCSDMHFKRKVLALSIYCKNKKFGCDWKGELRDINKHLNAGELEGGCDFVVVTCQCELTLQRKEHQNHSSRDCIQRRICCIICKHESTYKSLTQSSCPQCQTDYISCPNKCPDLVIRKHSAVQKHIDECPLQEQECKFSYAKCIVKVKRNQMQHHLDEYKDNHLELVDTHAKDLRRRLEILEKTYAQSAFNFPTPYHNQFPTSMMPMMQTKKRSNGIKIVDPATMKEVEMHDSSPSKEKQ